jgi:beta-lactamase class A
MACGLSSNARAAAPKFADELKRIEAGSGGRLGVAIFDTQAQAGAGYRTGERFPMCSTFKVLACSAVLKRVDGGQERLDRRIFIEAKDVVPGSSRINAPAIEGLTLGELCEAAMIYSDNTAANLILAGLGGPAGVTAFARTIGDTQTRLDRNEPALNDSIPGDPRDTTTPAAMVKNLLTLLLGNALASKSREQLAQWLIANKTGDTRLRAGLPAGWRIGDKTGTGERGSTNDIAIAWPPKRQPVLIAAYLTETTASAEKRNATLAAVGRAMVATLG